MHRKCFQIWKLLPDQSMKWTVFAAIIMTDNFDENFYDVICITTGFKFIKGNKLKIGSTVNDCQAEILARRCFINYLFSQIEMLIKNKY